MRVALFGDVHGSLPSLEALAADLKVTSPDALVCLGDLVDGFGWPRECVELARELVPALCVLGNAEWRVREWPGSTATLRDGAAPLWEWLLAELDEESRAYLAGLPLTATLEDVLLFHGQPDDPFSGIRPPPEEWPDFWHGMDFIVKDEARVAGALEGIEAPWMACAHTHVRMTRRFDGRTVVNPGPLCFGGYLVGGRMDAQYALLDREQDGGWRVTWRDLEYDKAAAADSLGRLPLVTPFMARVAEKLRAEG